MTTTWAPEETAKDAAGEKSYFGRSIPPLFRWPGGKRWLVPELKRHMPKTFGRYFEPFFGAGALFFSLQPQRSTISDSNLELMECYISIRDEPDSVGEALRGLGQDRANYYRVRAWRPSIAAERAARFIYLSTLAFNGIHRVNRRGEFNVPYSGRQYAGLGDAASLTLYSRTLGGAEILHGDFETSTETAVKGDLVYFDPPYTVSHDDNGFRKYNAKIFSWEDQLRLADISVDLARRGCRVIISNANHPSVRDLYPSFNTYPVTRQSSIAANPRSRGPAQELLLVNDN